MRGTVNQLDIRCSARGGERQGGRDNGGGGDEVDEIENEGTRNSTTDMMHAWARLSTAYAREVQ